MTWHTLGCVYLDLRQKEKLLEVIERLKGCPQGQIFGSLLLAIWHLTERELDQAGEMIEQLVSQAPTMPMPRILRAEWLNQVGAAPEARIQACRDVLRLHPGNQDMRRTLEGLQLQVQSPATVAGTNFSTSVVLERGCPASSAGRWNCLGGSQARLD